jgi:thiosulfate reductase/polysulfide reductase chain A
VPTETRKGNCHYCGYLCGFDVDVVEGRVVDMRPDPTRYPYDEAIVSRCRRWPMNLREIDGPTRLNYPLKRVGPRGSGRFERVSWDEALGDIATRLENMRNEYGAKALASAIGGPHATYWPLHRFLSLYGTPNNMGIGQICWNPRVWMDAVTFGWSLESDLDFAHTKAVVLWATNPAESDNSLFWCSLKNLHESGVPLVTIDSRQSRTARQSDVHLMPYPGTDCYLALALVHEIVEAGLYDHEFVDAWCHGFEGLCEHVRRFTPEFAQEKTGVPADDIRKVARIYAQADAAVLLSGRGIDQLGSNTAPTLRTLCILRAITGNIDKPGASFVQDASDFVSEVELEMSDRLSAEGRAAQLNQACASLQTYDGYAAVDQSVGRFGRHLPVRYLTSAHPGLVLEAMTSGVPYPIKALLVMAANPVVTYAGTAQVLEALKNLDLMVVLEYYMTPTAQMADYVLPIAGALERPMCQIHGGVANFAYGGAKAVEPYYERRTDYEVIYDLACRLGQQDDWPDATLDQAYDRMMARAGVSFAEFAENGLYAPAPRFGKYADIDTASGHPKGFATLTGKVELESACLSSRGGTAYPEPVDEAIARADLPARRVVLITGARAQPYWASSYFNDPELRAMHPEPLVTMNETTCKALGVEPGDWVDVRNQNGCARLKVKQGILPDGVASAEYGWWYPEEQGGLPHLSGAFRSNINALTTADTAHCEPLIGTWTYNGIEAFVTRASDGGDTVSRANMPAKEHEGVAKHD